MTPFGRVAAVCVNPRFVAQAKELLRGTNVRHREHRECTDRTIGFKAAGGICSVAEAAVYMGLAERIMGPDYVRPATFRIGAGGPLDDVPAVLKSRREAVPRAGDGY